MVEEEGIVLNNLINKNAVDNEYFKFVIIQYSSLFESHSLPVE